MSRLAIIVPYQGNSKALEETLVSVLENRPEDCQVIVVLGLPYDDPYDLGDEIQYVSAPSASNLADILNLGIDASNAPIIHLLTCGTTVTEGWADAALARFEEPQVAAVAPLVVDAEHPEKCVAHGMAYGPAGEIRVLKRSGKGGMNGNLPRRVMAPFPAGAFYRKSVVEVVGRFSPHVGDRLVWLDMGIMLQQLGWQCVLEPDCRVAPGDSQAQGRFHTALDAEKFFWRWAPVHGWSRSLALHALLVTGECLTGLVNMGVFAQLTGRTIGGCRGAFAVGARHQVNHVRHLARTRPAGAIPSLPRLRTDEARAATSLGQAVHRMKSAG